MANLTPIEILEKYPGLQTNLNWKKQDIGTFLRCKLLSGYHDSKKRVSLIDETSLIRHMSGVLTALLKDKKISPERLAKPFGYGAPFAQKYRTWLVKTGILKTSREAQLTPFGEVIWSHDSKFENEITKWFMHHQLSLDPENAEAWYFFIKSFLPKNKTFTKEDLQNQLAMKMMPHSEKHFRKGSPMNTRITNKLIECYTKPEGLGG